MSASGSMDTLVNNPGIFEHRLVEETSTQIWDRTMAINGRGDSIGAKIAILGMRVRGSGSIVIMSSFADLIGELSTAYISSMVAVRLLTSSVFEEPYQIRIMATAVPQAATSCNRQAC